MLTIFLSTVDVSEINHRFMQTYCNFDYNDFWPEMVKDISVLKKWH